MNNEELVQSLVREGYIRSEKVREAFLRVPREHFVPERYRDFAYVDEPLPIGEGQTISAPHMVAIMTEALEVENGMNILEIGTGSGYQAAILSVLNPDGKIITIERNPYLYKFAKKNLVPYKNVKIVLGDGTKGFPEEAPYDRILVTAGAPTVPEPLVKQLKKDGFMIIPVGDVYSQKLLKVFADGSYEDLRVQCVFVPLIGEHGWKE